MSGASVTIAEIIWWMLAAAATGGLIGWIMRGYRRDAGVRDEFAAMARTAEHEHQRLLDELVAAQSEVEALVGERADAPEDAEEQPAGPDDLQRRLDAANARILMLENELRASEEAAGDEAVPLAPEEPEEPQAQPDEPTVDDPLVEIAVRTRGDDPPADDDLKRIKGVGPRLEMMLKEAGITSFRQVARLTPDDIAVITEALKAFKGRIERDDWMGAAAEHHLAEYGEPVD